MELILLWWKCIAYDFTDNRAGCKRWEWIE